MKKHILIVLALLTGCNNLAAHQKVPTNNGTIIDLRTGKKLTAQQLITILSRHQRVIIGETHNNDVHHQTEHWLIKELSRQRPQGSLLLEMISPDQQIYVNRVKKLSPHHLPDGSKMPQALNWSKEWNWASYAPVVMTAIRAPYPLLSANLNHDETSAFYQHPYFPPGQFSSQPDVRQALAAIIRRSHNHKMGFIQLNVMLTIQQQRDRRMAKSLLAAPTPSLLIVGHYHAAKNLGVPLHIKDLQPGTLPVVLMLGGEGTWIDKRVADYQWMTSAAGP